MYLFNKTFLVIKKEPKAHHILREDNLYCNIAL